jgi:hypothetical protein
MGNPQRPKPEPRPTPEKPCGTPGAVYSTWYDPSFKGDLITVRIRVPISELIEKIDRPSLTAELHNALLPVIEKFYRDNWAHFAGQIIPGDDAPLPATYDELFRKYTA